MSHATLSLTLRKRVRNAMAFLKPNGLHYGEFAIIYKDVEAFERLVNYLPPGRGQAIVDALDQRFQEAMIDLIESINKATRADHYGDISDG